MPAVTWRDHPAIMQTYARPSQRAGCGRLVGRGEGSAGRRANAERAKRRGGNPPDARPPLPTPDPPSLSLSFPPGGRPTPCSARPSPATGRPRTWSSWTPSNTVSGQGSGQGRERGKERGGGGSGRALGGERARKTPPPFLFPIISTPSPFSSPSLPGTKGPFSLSLWMKTDPADTTGDTFGYPFSHSALVSEEGEERRGGREVRERQRQAAPNTPPSPFSPSSPPLQATPQAPAPTDPFHSPGVHILVPDAAQCVLG